MASTSLKPPPLSIYVHLPWCEKKCPYCDFNSHAIQNIVPEHDYLEALIVDLEQEKDFIQDRLIHSIFIGGGTPSQVPAGRLGDIRGSTRADEQLHKTGF